MVRVTWPCFKYLKLQEDFIQKNLQAYKILSIIQSENMNA